MSNRSVMNTRSNTPSPKAPDGISAQPVRRTSLLESLLGRFRKKPAKKEKNIYPLF
jgi:hypothetical protein